MLQQPAIDTKREYNLQPKNCAHFNLKNSLRSLVARENLPGPNGKGEQGGANT